MNYFIGAKAVYRLQFTVYSLKSRTHHLFAAVITDILERKLERADRFADLRKWRHIYIIACANPHIRKLNTRHQDRRI